MGKDIESDIPVLAGGGLEAEDGTPAEADGVERALRSLVDDVLVCSVSLVVLCLATLARIFSCFAHDRPTGS